MNPQTSRSGKLLAPVRTVASLARVPGLLAAAALGCLLPAAPPLLLAQGSVAAKEPAAAPGAQCPVPPRQGQPITGELREFRRVSTYYLVVDGKRQPAEIYMSERSGAGLVVSPAFRSAVVLKALALGTVSPAQLDKKADGSVDVKAGTVPAPQGTFTAGEDGMSFTVEGHQAALERQPPLLGLRRVDEVTGHNPEYLDGARGYAANRDAIAALRKEARPVTVRVYYGSWCSHCRKLVPHGVKVEEELRASKIRFEYFGVQTPDEVPGTKDGEGEIPTAVVYVNGAEAGRIVGDRAWGSPEVALRDILADRSGRGRGR